MPPATLLERITCIRNPMGFRMHVIRSLFKVMEHLHPFGLDRVAIQTERDMLQQVKEKRTTRLSKRCRRGTPAKNPGSTPCTVEIGGWDIAVVHVMFLYDDIAVRARISPVGDVYRTDPQLSLGVRSQDAIRDLGGSFPPCGGRPGWGVAAQAASKPDAGCASRSPHPNPPPQGGRESGGADSEGRVTLHRALDARVAPWHES
jgi:hypothetical protein